MTTLYTAGHLLTPDADGRRLIERQDAGLLVEQGVVVAVDDARTLHDDARRVVALGAGSWVFPGLVDTHVHLALDATPQPRSRLDAGDERDLLVLMLLNARKLLSAGVTTARDLGAPALIEQTVKAAVHRAEARGPRLVTATAPLTVTGGHLWFLGGECDGVDDVRRRVRRARRDGADVIKVMATGGHLTPGTHPARPAFTQAELEAVVDEAHHLGLRVTAHAHGDEGIRRAILAGVDSLEHFSFVQPDGHRVQDPALVALAAERAIWVCPTVSLAWAEAIRSGSFRPTGTTGRLVEQGVQVVAGTDAGVEGAFPEEYVAGLEGMHALGMPVEEVLLAATSRAADSLGRPTVTGRLSGGAAADFLVLGADPRTDLGRLRDTSVVVAAGRPYYPELRSSRTWADVLAGPQQTRPAVEEGRRWERTG